MMAFNKTVSKMTISLCEVESTSFTTQAPFLPHHKILFHANQLRISLIANVNCIYTLSFNPKICSKILSIKNIINSLIIYTKDRLRFHPLFYRRLRLVGRQGCTCCLTQFFVLD